ncbi:MAG: hypothetical protein LHW51_01975, partial [Candidatus Cloacimonetes bacterium]|nr:hypothetical protein [Candidatus Cloacimonadota bacterium]MCK9243173.1 hypothetical protein [Candidatus Cloacimonadota bacterium]
PLDWDVRHNATINYTFRIGRGEEFFVPFTNFILPLDDFSANINWSFVSGAPYTPQSTDSDAFLDTNSKRMDYTHQANARIAKGIRLPGGSNIRIFLDVENLFKTRNVLRVYPRTGDPWVTGEDLEDALVNFTYEEVEFTHGLASRNPYNVDNYRGVTLGVSFNF